MKKWLIIILIFFSIVLNNLLSQSSFAANLMPLQIGNVWIYRCMATGQACHCNTMLKYKINSSVSYNGKTYFVFSSEFYQLSCTQYYCDGPHFFYNNMRVDSTNGNIYAYSDTGCSNSPFEILVDSLNASLNDTVKNNCGTSQYKYICGDTAAFSIFGSSRRSKDFHETQFETGYGRKFSEGIGIVSGGQSSILCSRSSVLIGCVINGVAYGDTSFIVGINQISSEVPNEFSLSQNYPNPFNPTTKVKFQIPNSGFVKLIVYDLLGKEIQTLVNQQLSPGIYEVDFDGSNLPSGVYYYKLESGTFTETKKMVLVK